MKTLRIDVGGGQSVAGVLNLAANAQACYVFAHGAGADMNHRFMEAASVGLAERGISTLRYQFLYTETGSKRPDSPAVAHRAVRAAVAAAFGATRLPLIAGGKSFGGRMTSQAQASEPLPQVRGLAFLGFPLHPPERPSTDRSDHLADVHVPMLFIQGTRDKLAELARIESVVDRLGPRATLLRIEHADHGFDVLVRSGRKPNEVRAQMLDGLAEFCRRVVSAQ